MTFSFDTEAMACHTITMTTSRCFEHGFYLSTSYLQHFLLPLISIKASSLIHKWPPLPFHIMMEYFFFALSIHQLYIINRLEQALCYICSWQKSIHSGEVTIINPINRISRLQVISLRVCLSSCLLTLISPLP